MDDHTLQQVIDLAVKTAVLKAKKEAILTQFSWPVGSIYTSTKPTDPHELFGGKWKPIQDTFLWCAGPKHAAEYVKNGGTL